MTKPLRFVSPTLWLHCSVTSGVWDEWHAAGKGEGRRPDPAPFERLDPRTGLALLSYFLAGAFSTVMWVTAWCSPLSLSRQVSLTFSPAFRALR